MFMEFDWVEVPVDVWVRVLRGDQDAKDALGDMLDGLELYEHALGKGAKDGITVVTVADLELHGVIKGIVLKKNI